MTIKPLGDRALVKALAEEEMTKSGIILPETISQEKKAQGEIIALGSGEKIIKLNLKVGQKVIYGKYAGEEIKIDETEYKILSHEDILAVIE